MPNVVKKRGSKWVVVEIATGKVKSTHSSKRKAHISAAIRARAAELGAGRR